MTGREVVPLGIQPSPEPPAPVSRPGRLHGLSIIGIAASALLGIIATYTYVTVNLSGMPRRGVIAMLLFAILGFLVSAVAAVFSAARDTYAHPGGRSRT
jgi:uncharacterized membrane protein